MISILLGLLGLCLGSFAGAQVWRLRARQLVQDKAAGEPYDKKEFKRLSGIVKQSTAEDRSRCLHCGHQLAWYDLLPLVSWLSTGGKCRYCKKSIGAFEPMIELGMAAFFVVSYLVWPAPLELYSLEAVYFALWLIVGMLLIILFAYDFKWFLLPDVIVFPAMALAGMAAIVRIVQHQDFGLALLEVLGSVAILSGIYYAVYFAGERLGQAWIGFGDVKLGMILALMLADWQLAFLTLFLANLIGCIIVLPLMSAGKLSRGTHVPFGPMFIVGFFIAGLWGRELIDWYLSMIFFIA